MDPITIALGLGKRFWKEILVVVLILGAIWAANHWLDARDKANYTAGWHARDALVQQEVNKAVAARAAQIQKNAEDTRRRDAAASQKLQAENQAFAQANRQLRASLERQKNTPFKPNPENPDEKPLLGQSVLLPADVGLLNAARVAPVRLDQHGRAAFDFDGEVQAPSYAGPTVTGGELAENDLEVVRLYRELAIKHDGLVDWVNAQCVAPQKPSN